MINNKISGYAFGDFLKIQEIKITCLKENFNKNPGSVMPKFQESVERKKPSAFKAFAPHLGVCCKRQVIWMKL